MRVGPLKVRYLSPFYRQQTVLHPLELLADDEQPGLRQQRVDVGYPPGQTVFARQHAQTSRVPSRTASIAASNDRQGRVFIAG